MNVWLGVYDEFAPLVAPVMIAAPPLDAVYQLMVLPDEVAFKLVIGLPAHTNVALAGVTDVGAPGKALTLPESVLVQPPGAVYLKL